MQNCQVCHLQAFRQYQRSPTPLLAQRGIRCRMLDSYQMPLIVTILESIALRIISAVLAWSVILVIGRFSCSPMHTTFKTALCCFRHNQLRSQRLGAPIIQQQQRQCPLRAGEGVEILDHRNSHHLRISSQWNRCAGRQYREDFLYVLF